MGAEAQTTGTRLLAVVTTVATGDDAQRIASALVERRLAACVHITEIESVYSWQGTLQQEREFRLVAKTVATRYPALEQAIREMHRYELPAIYALPIERAFEPYVQWVSECSSD